MSGTPTPGRAPTVPAPGTALSDAAIAELGSTEAGAEALGALSDGAHTRRLLLFRVLLDALDSDALPPGRRAAAREHGALLEAADRAAPRQARRVMFYPLTGPWAETCVRQLDRGTPDHRDIDHLGPVAAAAAARAGLTFRTRVTPHHDGIALPTLGLLRHAGPARWAELHGRRDTLTIRPLGARPAELRRDAAGHWHSHDPRWSPLPTLSGGPRPVLLDDLDPCRATPGAATPAGPPHQRAHWRAMWRRALPLLRLGGAARAADLALLDCVVPLPGPTATGRHTSHTRDGAFGAVLASPPPSPELFAAGLVHELQHAKLAALTELVALHTADDTSRHWAPWRPDPRPFDGLLHGAYAHLALAALWQRLALTRENPLARDDAWAAHARCAAQVGAVLPVLRGARPLTDPGRAFVKAMTARHSRLADHPPPREHRVRAAAYVDTARSLWHRHHPQ
ncbi:aKG-HExxH-type peptide beta-hydroxylase [Streptomyces xiamenensis]|uniref:aKG-HExxH-type peptide beta-hydroxylase n=1 Tax=Streptomyces TaxID=1883 RepID=UPI000A79E7CF|nr:HEXXH motif-containing putative peptide modification protein [Streptomyces sp. NRRL F-2890]